MPPKVAPWTAEQITFIMEQSTSGVKPAEIGKQFKTRWPDRGIGKGVISSLISRQKKSKKKTAGQGVGQSSRETSAAPSMSARSEFSESVKHPIVGSPRIPETPRPCPTSAVQEFMTPKTSPIMQPFSSFKTPPAAPHNTPYTPISLEKVKLSVNVIASSIEVDEPETTTEPFPDYDDDLAVQLLAEDEMLENSPEAFDPNSITGFLMRQKRLSADRLLAQDVDEEAGGVSIKITEAAFRELKAKVSVAEKVEAEGGVEAETDMSKAVQKEQIDESNVAEEIDTDATDIAETACQVQSSISTVEEIDFDVIEISEPPHQLQTNITAVVKIEVETPEIDEPVYQFQTKLTSIDEIEIETREIDEPETRVEGEVTGNAITYLNEYQGKLGNVCLPAAVLQEFNPAPTNFPQNTSQVTTAPDPKISNHTELLFRSLPKELQDKMAGRKPSPTPPPSPVRMPNFADCLGREIVVLYVGPKRKEYPVHGNLLRINSSVFHDFIFPLGDAGEGEHYLPDADPSSVSVIINWLYRQSASSLDMFVESVCGDVTALPTGTDEPKRFQEAVNRAIGVYVLAEELAIDPLKDLVMTALGQAYNRHKAFPTSGDIVTVYSRTDARSRLRKYMARSYQVIANFEDADIVSAGWTVEEVDEVVATVPALFKDFRALNRKSKGVESTELSADLVCSYHVHDGTEACVSDGLTFSAR